jgi:hypothetical protein
MNDQIELSERLVRGRHKALGQSVPESLHRRLERQCELAYEAGEPQQPSKMVMLAAILAESTLDPSELRRMLATYGEATNADALPWLDRGADIVEFPARHPGPRTGRRA